MIYPEILDVNLKRQAIIEKAFNYYTTKVVNKNISFSFDMPADDPKAKYITEQNYVQINGQIYTIDRYEPSRTEKNELLLNVSGLHIFHGLREFYWDKDGEVDNYRPNASAQDVLNELLQGTPYKLVNCTISKRTDIMLERGNILKNVMKVVKAYGGELVRDNYKISLVTMIGEDNDSQFRYKKNQRSIKKTVDTSNLVTRLYVYGKDGLTIEGVNDGKKYLDSEYIDRYTYPKTSEIVFKDEVNPTELLELGKQYLKDNEIPQVSYDVKIIDLQKQTKDEKFDYGDTVHVIDPELKIRIKARVMKYVEYPKPEEAHKSSVVIGSIMPSMTDFYVGFETSRKSIDKITTGKGNLSTSYMEGAINTLQNHLKASGAYAKAEVLEDAGYLLENTDPTSPDFGALYMGPGIFAIAADKLNGKWNWRTFGTGKGFVADEIITGTLNASLVNVVNLNASNIVTGTLTADFLKGGTIDADDIDVINLNASNITAGTLVADYIRGGTLRGVHIEVDDDIKVGNSIELGDQSSPGHKFISFGSSVYIGTPGGGDNLGIFSKTGSVDISAEGKVDIFCGEANINGSSIITSNNISNFVTNYSDGYGINVSNGRISIDSDTLDNNYCQNASSQNISFQEYDGSLEVFVNSSLVGTIALE